MRCIWSDAMRCIWSDAMRCIWSDAMRFLLQIGNRGFGTLLQTITTEDEHIYPICRMHRLLCWFYIVKLSKKWEEWHTP